MNRQQSDKWASKTDSARLSRSELHIPTVTASPEEEFNEEMGNPHIDGAL